MIVLKCVYLFDISTRILMKIAISHSLLLKYIKDNYFSSWIHKRMFYLKDKDIEE